MSRCRREQPVRVHTWSDAGQPGLVPFVWAHPRDPATEAARVATELADRDDGHRAVFLNLHPPLGAADLPRVVSEGRITFDATWHNDFFWELSRQRVRLDRIILDYERGLRVWHKDMRPAIRAIYADPALVKRLPRHLRAMSGEWCDTAHPRFKEFAHPWDQWASDLLADALRQTVRTSKKTPVTNYHDLRLRDDERHLALDINGWMFPSASVSRESSPSIYLSTGHRHWTGNLTRWKYAKHPLWVRLIDVLNIVRASLRAGAVVPWVSSPSWTEIGLGRESYNGSRWAWEQLIRHVHAAGVDTFLLWNPHEHKNRLPDDEAFAAGVFASLGKTRRQKRLPVLDINVDTIETVNAATGERIVSRYEEGGF